MGLDYLCPLASLRNFPLLAIARVSHRRTSRRHVCETDDNEERKKCPVDPRKGHDTGDDSTCLRAPAAGADVGELVREDGGADEVQHPDDDVEKVFDGIGSCNAARLDRQE